MPEQGGGTDERLAAMSLLIWREDRWQPAGAPVITVDDGGFLFGDTLFETLLVRDGKPLFLAEHLDRLELSAHLSAFLFNRAAATALLGQALANIPLAIGRLRLTLSRGACNGLVFPTTPAEIILTLAACAEPTDHQRQTGWRAISAPNQRVNPLSHLPQLKRGNYADCLYAFNHARRCGADEALFSTPEGELLEGSLSNLFLVRAGQLQTPPLGTLVLAGVVRRQLLDIAQSLGLAPVEMRITRADLWHADEVFLSNSLLLLMPLAELDGRPLPRGPAWKALLEQLNARAARDRNE